MLWLLIGYMFLFIHRPFEFWPALGDLHVERLYVVGVFAVWMLQPKRWLPNPQHLAYAAFAVAVGLCWMMSPFMDEGAQVVEGLVQDPRFLSAVRHNRERREEPSADGARLRVVMGVYMTHSFKEYLSGRYTFRMGIPRMIGIDTSQGDPNSFGASIVFALPFAALFWNTSRSKFIRFCVILYLCLSTGCILLTGSRSSLLGLVLWCAITIIAQPASLLGTGLRRHRRSDRVRLLPDDLQTRFETIVNPDVGPENAKVSGEGRLEGLEKGSNCSCNSRLPAAVPARGGRRPIARSNRTISTGS